LSLLLSQPAKIVTPLRNRRAAPKDAIQSRTYAALLS
jgi:hypothetical protein